MTTVICNHQVYMSSARCATLPLYIHHSSSIRPAFPCVSGLRYPYIPSSFRQPTPDIYSTLRTYHTTNLAPTMVLRFPFPSCYEEAYIYLFFFALHLPESTFPFHCGEPCTLSRDTHTIMHAEDTSRVERKNQGGGKGEERKGGPASQPIHNGIAGVL